MGDRSRSCRLQRTGSYTFLLTTGTVCGLRDPFHVLLPGSVRNVGPYDPLEPMVRGAPQRGGGSEHCLSG